ncbi:hypothetical protein F5148DRAFT_253049 [Russula earlei]|uniref:Uncharacterized protein n=1 Tax=Russula earlei TaxID=71964 RepID=A0ACC0U343_9AGAM|nr:hypothetical protein F5148DRAFT_253049 [Russula earlei]
MLARRRVLSARRLSYPLTACSADATFDIFVTEPQVTRRTDWNPFRYLNHPHSFPYALLSQSHYSSYWTRSVPVPAT